MQKLSQTAPLGGLIKMGGLKEKLAQAMKEMYQKRAPPEHVQYAQACDAFEKYGSRKPQTKAKPRLKRKNTNEWMQTMYGEANKELLKRKDSVIEDHHDSKAHASQVGSRAIAANAVMKDY